MVLLILSFTKKYSDSGNISYGFWIQGSVYGFTDPYPRDLLIVDSAGFYMCIFVTNEKI